MYIPEVMFTASDNFSQRPLQSRKYGQYYSQLPYNSHWSLHWNSKHLTVTIPLGNTVRNLHAQIQQQLPQQFRNVPFYLRAFRPGLVSYVAMRQGGLISNYFD